MELVISSGWQKTLTKYALHNVQGWTCLCVLLASSCDFQVDHCMWLCGMIPIHITWKPESGQIAVPVPVALADLVWCLADTGAVVLIPPSLLTRLSLLVVMHALKMAISSQKASETLWVHIVLQRFRSKFQPCIHRNRTEGQLQKIMDTKDNWIYQDCLQDGGVSLVH